MNFQGVFKGLKGLLEHSGNVADDIMTNFEISYDVFGSPITYELVKNGKEVTVTNENRRVGIFFLYFTCIWIYSILNLFWESFGDRASKMFSSLPPVENIFFCQLREELTLKISLMLKFLIE